MEPLYVEKLTAAAIVPTRGSTKAAGYDLYAPLDYTIPPNGKGMIKTDIAVGIPPGHYGRIAPRSGFSWKQHTHIGAGVIDEDYRGNVGVIVFNLSPKENVVIKRGDRIAQLILEQISTPPIVTTRMLTRTERGTGGFGSTGI